MQEMLILFTKIWKPYANPKRKKMFHIENTFVENELLYLRQILVWLREPELIISRVPVLKTESLFLWGSVSSQVLFGNICACPDCQLPWLGAGLSVT